MTFLNSLFLLALPLIAVPLLLHFLRRQERKVVNWGAMRFLQEASTESRKVKLPESLLLLLARCLLVVGLIFALARPMINWGNSNKLADRELIVIVDDSLSTARRIDGEPVFDQIRDAAEKVISESPTNLPFQLMLASGGGQWIGDQPQATDSAAGKLALAELEKHQPTLGMANLMGCIQKAISAANERETSTRPRPAQRILVVTDSTAPAWSDSNETVLQRMRSMIEQNKLPIKIQVLEIESPTTQFRNLSVVQLDSDTDQVGVKESFRVRAEVQNTGAVTSEACRLAWSVKEKVIGHSSVSELEPGQSTEISWATKFEDAGPVAVEAKLEQDNPDDLPEDSIAIKVVDVVDQIPILLVDNQSLTGTADLESQQIKLLTLALGYDGEEASETYHAIFAPTIIPASEINGEDLSSYSAIIVAGTKNDSTELSELLLPEVRRGCGVWVVMSAGVDVDAFNTNWFQDGVGLSPMALEALDESPSEENLPEQTDDVEEIRIHPSAQHPATRVLSDQQRIDLDEVVLQQHAYFQQLLLGDEVSAPLQTNRGQPLVVENSIGRGRVLIQSFPINLETSNLPVTNSFVVMVHQWLEYLAKPSTRSFNLNTGSPLVWDYEDRNARPASLSLPDGTKVDLTENAVAHGLDQPEGTFRYFATRLPGLYRARTSAMADVPIEVPFYISTDRAELLAAPMAEENRSELSDVGGFELANSLSDLTPNAQEFWSQQDAASSTVGGSPIWQWIVLGLLGLLILELLLAGKVGQQRVGSAQSATKQLNMMQQSLGNSDAITPTKTKSAKKKPVSVS